MDALIRNGRQNKIMAAIQFRHLRSESREEGGEKTIVSLYDWAIAERQCQYDCHFEVEQDRMGSLKSRHHLASHRRVLLEYV